MTTMNIYTHLVTMASAARMRSMRSSRTAWGHHGSTEHPGTVQNDEHDEEPKKPHR